MRRCWKADVVMSVTAGAASEPVPPVSVGSLDSEDRGGCGLGDEQNEPGAEIEGLQVGFLSRCQIPPQTVGRGRSRVDLGCRDRDDRVGIHLYMELPGCVHPADRVQGLDIARAGIIDTQLIVGGVADPHDGQRHIAKVDRVVTVNYAIPAGEQVSKRIGLNVGS